MVPERKRGVGAHNPGGGKCCKIAQRTSPGSRRGSACPAASPARPARKATRTAEHEAFVRSGLKELRGHGVCWKGAAKLVGVSLRAIYQPLDRFNGRALIDVLGLRALPEGLKLAAHKVLHSGWVGELVPQELGEPVAAAPLPEPCSAAAGIAKLGQDQKRVDRHLRLAELIELALPGALERSAEGRQNGAGRYETIELKRLDELFKLKPKMWHNAYQAYVTSEQGKRDIQAELPNAGDYSKACSAAWRKIAPEPKARVCVRAPVRARVCVRPCVRVCACACVCARACACVRAWCR